MATPLVVDHVVGVVLLLAGQLVMLLLPAHLVDLLLRPTHALAVLPLAAMDQIPLVVVQVVAKPNRVYPLVAPSQTLPTTRLGTQTVMSHYSAALVPARKYR